MYNINAFPAEHLLEYHEWVGTDKNKAIALCTLNVDLSEAFYPALNMFEVTLRNSINRSFVEHYGIDWIFQDIIKYQTINTRKSIAPKKSKFNTHLTSEQSRNTEVVPEMNLFYWTNILDPINSHLWEERGVKPIFRTSMDINNLVIFEKVNELRRLRNRIAHLKSIIQRNLLTEYDHCREIIGLLSQDALIWCDSKSRFLNIHPNDIIIENDFLSPKIDLTPWMQYREIYKE